MLGSRAMHPTLHTFNLSTRALLLMLASLALVVAMVQFAQTVFALRAQRATGPNWSFPSRVYSDAVPLTVGRTASDAYLRSELAAREYVEASGSPEAPGNYVWSPGRFDIVLRGFQD